MRVVFDTSVYVAAFLKNGFAEDVFKRCYERDIDLFTSPAILQELARTLSYKLEQPIAEVRKFLEVVAAATTIFDTEELSATPKAFDGDEHLLACCIAADAKLLVTLDKKLLKAKRFQDIGVVHPRALLWMLVGREDAA